MTTWYWVCWCSIHISLYQSLFSYVLHSLKTPPSWIQLNKIFLIVRNAMIRFGGMHYLTCCSDVEFWWEQYWDTWWNELIIVSIHLAYTVDTSLVWYLNSECFQDLGLSSHHSLPWYRFGPRVRTINAGILCSLIPSVFVLLWRPSSRSSRFRSSLPCAHCAMGYRAEGWGHLDIDLSLSRWVFGCLWGW